MTSGTQPGDAEPTQPYGVDLGKESGEAAPPPPPPPTGAPVTQPMPPPTGQPIGQQTGQPVGRPVGQPMPAMAYPGMAYGVSPEAPYGVDPRTGIPYSDKQKLIAGLLQIFLGGFGVGRFYIGDTTTGVLQIVVTVFTCGIGSLWGLIDGIIMLTKDDTKDSRGYILRPN